MSQELWGNNIGQGEKRSKIYIYIYIYIHTHTHTHTHTYICIYVYTYTDGFTDQGKLEHVMVDGRGQIFYLSSH